MDPSKLTTASLALGRRDLRAGQASAALWKARLVLRFPPMGTSTIGGRLVVAIASLCTACARQESSLPRPDFQVQGPVATEEEQQERGTILLAAEHREQTCNADPKSKAEVCWGPSKDSYRAATDEHLRLIAAHRKAAERLREATEQACAGLAGFDRDVSPFAHTSDIVRVEPIAPEGHVEGASATFRRVRGLSSEKLQRIVDCHIAQAEELDHRVPEESFCPLNPPDVRATVKDAVEGYVIDVTSTDQEAAKEVLRRALDLVAGKPLTGAAR
jgi:hypothetical protein